MNRLILGLVLVSISNFACAEWKFLGNSNPKIYVDSGTLIRNGGNATLWNLFDYSAGSKEYMSAKHKFEFQCNEKMMRSLMDIFYTGSMGQGTVIQTYDQPESWMQIAPNSINEALWKVACVR